jgi:hypothetical protein
VTRGKEDEGEVQERKKSSQCNLEIEIEQKREIKFQVRETNLARA